MTDLSPAAQAVLDALYMEELNGPQQLMARAHAAAALRAAADQLINVNWSVEMWELHRDIYAIAAELEGTDAG
jgi:hypothetical protein